MESILGLKMLKVKAELKTNKMGPKRGPDQHGVWWWANKYGCNCHICAPVRKAANAERARRQRERRRDQGIPPAKVGWTHGTKYGWEKKKCKCDKCQDHYIAWAERRRQKAEEQREQERRAEEERAQQALDRLRSRTNRTEATEGHRQSSLASA